MDSKKQSRTGVSEMNSYEYGHPACEIIETETGIVPDSCEKEKLPPAVHQSQRDGEENYDLDGVSMNGSRVLVASTGGQRSD